MQRHPRHLLVISVDSPMGGEVGLQASAGFRSPTCIVLYTLYVDWMGGNEHY